MKTIIYTLCALGIVLFGSAGAKDLATPAETMRARLAEAGLEVGFDQKEAAKLVVQAQGAYQTVQAEWQGADSQSAGQVKTALKQAEEAAKAGDQVALARARAKAWTALLYGASIGLENSVTAGKPNLARDWLAVREFRVASSLTRLNADATEAVEDLAGGKIQPQEALAAIRSDVLDGYQARFNDALRDLKNSEARGFKTLAAEQKALAVGYFRILEPSFKEQRGAEKTTELKTQLLALPTSLMAVQQQLEGFRAAPLSQREVKTRAAQVTRFLNLVPVEYGRGVILNNGEPTIKLDFEINEARTFLSGAVSALSDIAPLIKDQGKARELTSLINGVEQQISASEMKQTIPPPDEIKSKINQALSQTRELFPAEWQKADAGADLDVVRTQLDAVVAAAASGEWAAAETARIDAYSLLESGTEARIAVFNPDLKVELENLIWNGQKPKGLFVLIKEKAPLSEFKNTRAELQVVLKKVGKILGTEVAPAAVATNAGIIVFREGLEAVLILAALMGSLRKSSLVRLRRPMWLGAILAGVATAATWFVMQGAISLLGRYGEKLEAVVSLIAIGVLLLIMNWFFHQVYWTDRMAAFQKHKHELTHQSGALRAQWWGLLILGFTSIYREGFETVLFLQSLVLQSGVASVMSGTALGLVLVIAIGVLVFKWQAKLPMKKLLIWTGMLICVVLGVMVGNTVHTLQLVGWLPVHPLPVQLPGWLGLWLGIHSTWEGIGLQVFSQIAVIGSFFAAEALKEKQLAAKRQSIKDDLGEKEAAMSS